jgi:prolyl 4-hydroxylase
MALSAQHFRLLLLSLSVLVCVGQVNIKKESDGYVRQTKDESAVDKEIYTSMHELAMFFETEKEYVEHLRAILDKKLVSVDTRGAVGAYISSYEDVLGEQDDDESFLYNPLNVYALIRHIAVGWGIVEESLEKEKKKQKQAGADLPKRVKKVMARRKKDHIPGELDLDGVAVGIVRLHDYYNFNTTSFVEEGVFETNDWKVETTGDLTVWDAFKIGVKGTNHMFLGSGIEIMMHAFDKAKTEGMVSTPPFIDQLDMKVLKNLIKTAKTVHDQKLDRWGPRTPTHSTNHVPYDKRLAKKKKFASSTKDASDVVLMNARIVDQRQETEQYMRLCRGEELRAASVTSKLTCRYESKGKPYYIYGPRKIEVVSLRPHIALLHDFITNGESDELKATAAPKLKRSQMVGNKINGTLDDRRVSETTWLHEDDSEAAERISKRMDYFLDLETRSTNHSELFQVANYGLAGQYQCHYDQVMMDKGHIQNREMFNLFAGDRMMTAMGYLSDVLAGGYTVFPLVGAHVKPEKGTMVVWWNMDRAGGHDVLTRHGGCPVMIGSKWITNKWVRSNSQMFKRPCPKYTSRQIREFRNSDRFNMQKGGWFTDP